jgi:hypothetical protein
MKTVKTEWERRTEKNINSIKKAIQNLRANKLEIYIDKNIENLMGKIIDNVYVRDTLSNGTVIYQKHLFTV